MAHRGTIFLDEAGELPAETQVLLLRVLQERIIERVGGTEPIAVDVRVIAATHQDLELAMKEGRFRSDLFFRLNVFPIHVPPLRERREDIADLVRHFLRHFGRRMNKQVDQVSPAVARLLTDYDWPGNVRELENIIERAMIVATPPVLHIDPSWLPARSAGPSADADSTGLAEVDRQAIVDALKRCHGKIYGRNGAAAVLAPEADHPVRQNAQAPHSQASFFTTGLSGIFPTTNEREIMRIFGLATWFAFSMCLLLPPTQHLTADGKEKGKVRLFILSGQSNMARLDPDVSFTPALKKAFPQDDVIVVKSAQGGQSIQRWYKGWKAPANVKVKPAKGEAGDLYDLLMGKVKAATQGKTMDTVAFVWMQGESDAQRGLAGVYEESLRGLIKQLRDDLKRPDMVVVIGRISDFKKGEADWDSVRTAQEKVAGADPLARWVDTDNLDGPKKALHHTVKGYEVMGRLFAAKALELLSKKQH